MGCVPIRQYQVLFNMDGITLEFDDAALDAVADKAIERKTGARGLRSIIEDTLKDIMFEAPSDSTITKIVITKVANAGSTINAIFFKKS